MDDVQRIRKIKLSNNQVYSIFDEGALRLDENKNLVTGNSVVDELIIKSGLSITEIDDVDVTDSITNVLVQGEDGLIQKRTINQLLEDIGGFACMVDSTNNTLKLKTGKF